MKGYLFLALALLMVVGLFVALTYWEQTRRTRKLKGKKARRRNRLQPSLAETVELPDEKYQEELYQLTGKLSHLLKEEGVDHWMIGGTLLGAVRHKAIIPWDDDVDFGYWQHDDDRISNMQVNGIFGKYGMKAKRSWFGWKVFAKKSRSSYKKEPPFVDLFQCKSFGDEVAFSYTKARLRYPTEKYLFHELYPLRLYSFGPIEIPGPKNPMPYLKRKFGPNWATEAIGHKQHCKVCEHFRCGRAPGGRTRLSYKPFKIPPLLQIGTV